jgi:hypothetical protein
LISVNIAEEIANFLMEHIYETPEIHIGEKTYEALLEEFSIVPSKKTSKDILLFGYKVIVEKDFEFGFYLKKIKEKEMFSITKVYGGRGNWHLYDYVEYK